MLASCSLIALDLRYQRLGWCSYLSNNAIETILGRTFGTLPKLQFLDLQRNNVARLPYTIFSTSMLSWNGLYVQTIITLPWHSLVSEQELRKIVGAWRVSHMAYISAQELASLL